MPCERLAERQQTATNPRFHSAKRFAKICRNLRVRHAVKKAENDRRALTRLDAAKRQDQASTIVAMQYRGHALPIELSDELEPFFLSADYGTRVALPRA